MSTAAANEATYNLGVPDLHPASELADYLEAEREAEDDRWEREGRAEMYAMLELTGY